MFIVTAFMVAAAILATMNTMFTAVSSRKRELATMRAIGFKRRTILMAMVIESAFVAKERGIGLLRCMDKKLEHRVRRRAHDCCEYCHMPQAAYRFRFPIDHIIARQHGGKTTFQNCAVACLRCNAHKGPNIAGVDPRTGEIVRLFHPRRDKWFEHFRWRGALLLGQTPIARATIVVLSINHPRIVGVREALMAEGAFPFLK